MQVSVISRFRIGPRRRVLIPFASSRVCAGFPSPADDYLDKVIDLNELCIDQPHATFFVRASGISMTGGIADIHDGDILIVNRGKRPTHKKIVVACIQGEFTVKRLRLEGRGKESRGWLDADNPEFPSLSVNQEGDVTIWGVVTWIFRPI